MKKKRDLFDDAWESSSDKLLRGLGAIFPPFVIIKEKEWMPAIDIYETHDLILVKAELAGVRREDLKIEVIGRNLIIIGERRDKAAAQREFVHQVEIDYGRFRRQLELPSEVDYEKAQAEINNGFLTLILPKRNASGKVVDIPIE